MSSCKVLIAAAGSGKTTHLVREALKPRDGRCLITTYTEANEASIRKAIVGEHGCIPSRITVQTWFSFLIQHGVRPYQGKLNAAMFDEDIQGLLLVNGPSAVRYTGRYGPVCYAEDSDFVRHYFSTTMKVYSDKVSKFVFKANRAASGEVISRIARIYSHVFIDEVQDLAGYDLELISLLLKSKASLLLVGDPRQVTYLTHHERKHVQYRDGKVRAFLEERVPDRFRPKIDEETLSRSHRNNDAICRVSSGLFPDLPASVPCDCRGCRGVSIDHTGVFLVRPKDVARYLRTYAPVQQLRWDRTVAVDEEHPVLTLGNSKGLTFDRVMIYPTDDMRRWILDRTASLSAGAKAKFYVGLTRPRHSAAIVMDLDGADVPSDMKRWSAAEAKGQARLRRSCRV